MGGECFVGVREAAEGRRGHVTRVDDVTVCDTAEEYDDGIFGDIDQFFNEFDVTTQPDYWSVEAVYLQPGTRL